MTTTYSNYREEKVCDDCGHAQTPYQMGVDVCPECGGHLTKHVGRWLITEEPERWYDWIIGKWFHTTYHKFIVGREAHD